MPWYLTLEENGSIALGPKCCIGTDSDSAEKAAKQAFPPGHPFPIG